MTPKYSAEWWEKVAARPPIGATVQPKPSRAAGAERDRSASEPVGPQARQPIPLEKVR